MAGAKKDKATTIDQATPEDTAPEQATEGEPPNNGLTEEEIFREGSHWYVVHTYSGYEDKVQANLEHRITTMDAQDLVFRVVIPSVNEIEIRDGQRRTVPKKILPGYVLVQDDRACRREGGLTGAGGEVEPRLACGPEHPGSDRLRGIGQPAHAP